MAKFNQKEYDKQYYLKNKEKREQQIKKYDKEHKQEKAQFNRQYYKDNMDEVKKQVKKYSQTFNGKENHRLAKIKRKIMKNNIIDSFTDKEWDEKKQKTKGVCPGCNTFVGLDKLELDHIFPIYRANIEYKKTGIKRKYTIDDVRPLCKSCNSSKRNSLIAEVWADAFNYVTEIKRMELQYG